MSDFAGLWRLDGKPADPADLERLTQGLDGRGVGPARVRSLGPLTLIHRQHLFTPQDRHERQPLSSAQGMVLAADCRLSGRDDLARALGMGDPRQQPDSALILAACERWGPRDALPRLYGDFALALWQPDRRCLTLARDPSGYRPLFLHRGPRLVAFSTRLRALLALPDIPRDLDEEALARQMILHQGPPHRTIYTAIDRLPMGWLAEIGPDGSLAQTPWWDIPRPADRPLLSDQRMLEKARAVLDAAVGDGLRAETPVTLALTGGLDSNAIAVSALDQLAPRPLLAMTRVPDAPPPPDAPFAYHDESPRVRDFAARHPGLDWQAIRGDGGDWGENDPGRWLLQGGLPMRASLNISWFFPIYRAMAARGSRVMLSGEQGNGFFSQTGLDMLPQLLLDGRWGTLGRHLLALPRHEGIGMARLIVRHVLRPFEPVPVLQRHLRRPPEPWGHHAALNPAFAAELRLGQRLDLDRYRQRIGGGHASLSERRRWLLQDEDTRDIFSTMRAMTGMDFRMPLADRRVLEFFGTLPLEQIIKDGVTRWPARRILAERAPPSIVDNHASGRQNGDWFARLSARHDAMTADMSRLRASPLARRVVDLDRLDRLLRAWPADAAAAEPHRREYFQMLTRGLDMARFLAWHEGANS